MRCPKCGANTESSKFCPECGAKLPNSEKSNVSSYEKAVEQDSLWKGLFVVAIIATALSLMLFCIFLGPVFGIIAIVLSSLCLKKTDRSRVVLIICIVLSSITTLFGSLFLLFGESSDSSGSVQNNTAVEQSIDEKNETDASVEEVYSKKILKQIKKVDKYISNGKYEKASELLNEIELSDSDSEKVRMKLDLMLAQGLYDDAAGVIFNYSNSKEDKSQLADDVQFNRLVSIKDYLNGTNKELSEALISEVSIAKIESVSGHDWKEATCTEPKTCQLCGETEGECLGHDWVEATCTEPMTCVRCGEVQGEALGHVCDEWKIEKDASCSEEGVETGVCTVCGEMASQSIPKLEHEEGKWEIQVEATDATSGKRVKCCKVCGEVLTTENYSLSEEEKEQYYKDQCESVSYDDLIRYPDKYTNKPIKVKVKILEVETVDSFLFEDLYEAKLDGKSISITDGREVKEPKLREGDSVVIYGVGDGYNTQYSYEKGLILGLPKNIESEKIPNIKMLYVAF